MQSAVGTILRHVRFAERKTRASHGVRAALLATMLTAGMSGAAHTAEPVSEAEARAIGADAYAYFYPLITMDLTRLQFTNVEPGKEPLKGPLNTFVNIPEYPDPPTLLFLRALRCT